METHALMKKYNLFTWAPTFIKFALSIALFLIAIDLMSVSVGLLGQDAARSLIVDSNPFIGFFIGLLATALMQSSSIVSAMTVAIVASGALPLTSAVPIVLGANIGTTLTSTLVALGFIGNRNLFRKAISGATIHDFFNIVTAVIVFPLEYYFGFLSKLSQGLIQITGLSNGQLPNEGQNFTYGFSKASNFFAEMLPNNVFAIIISLVLLYISVKILSRVIYTRLIGSSKDKLQRYIFANPFKSFGWGIVITSGVQSSSITSSLIVPLVASSKIQLKHAFPFIMGANIGTTITALIAAINKSDAALSLALVHLIFNLIGVLIFLPWPVLRRIPVWMAYKFGVLTLDSRVIGFSYVLFTFFLLPFTLIYIGQQNNKESNAIETNTLDDHTSSAIIIVEKEKPMIRYESTH